MLLMARTAGATGLAAAAAERRHNREAEVRDAMVGSGAREVCVATESEGLLLARNVVRSIAPWNSIRL